MEKNKVAGFDLSLSSTGFSVKGKTDILTSKKKGEERLQEYYIQFNNLIKEYKFEVAILENYAFSSPFQREALAELGGVFKLACANNNVIVVMIPPTSLKKFVTGGGKAKKDEMRLYAYKKWGIEFETNDEVDAYALRKLGEKIVSKEPVTQYESEVIARVLQKLSPEAIEKLRS